MDDVVIKALEARIVALETAGRAVAVLQPASHAANADEAARWARFYDVLNASKCGKPGPSPAFTCRLPPHEGSCFEFDWTPECLADPLQHERRCSVPGCPKHDPAAPPDQGGDRDG